VNPSCYLNDPIIELDGNVWARSYDGRRALLDRSGSPQPYRRLDTQSLGLAIKGGPTGLGTLAQARVARPQRL
jgi:hypothetical protein